MSVNFTQKCIIGIKLSREDVINVVSEPIYETQSRYDIKTGKETSKSKVLVKEGEESFDFMGYSSYDLYELGEVISSNTDLNCITCGEEEYLYIGKKIGDNHDYGRADLIEGSISSYNAISAIQDVRNIFPSYEVSLHFITHVG
jgi:hypothetical protein